MKASMLMAVMASVSPIGIPLPSSALAPKNPPRKPPPNMGWQGDGVEPERETRQQRRLRERLEVRKGAADAS